MPSKNKITEEVYVRCKDMLSKMLYYSSELGVGYVIQLIYELAVVVVSYECQSAYALDKYFREYNDTYKILVTARNTLNHNSYDMKRVYKVMRMVIETRAVELLYRQLFGEAKDYKVFETECYVYLEYMRRLWSDGR